MLSLCKNIDFNREPPDSEPGYAQLTVLRLVGSEAEYTSCHKTEYSIHSFRCAYQPSVLRSVRFHSVISPPRRVPKTAFTSSLFVELAESITLPNASRACRGRLRIPHSFRSEVNAMLFWDAYYLEKIQEMKAQRKAELEEVGKL